MADSFDPYSTWLDVRETERPLDFYQLLDLAAFESDPRKIAVAIDERTARIKPHLDGPRATVAAAVMAELAAARSFLLRPEKKYDYDRGLRQKAAKATHDADDAPVGERFTRDPHSSADVPRLDPVRKSARGVWAIIGGLIALVVLMTILLKEKYREQLLGNADSARTAQEPPRKSKESASPAKTPERPSEKTPEPAAPDKTKERPIRQFVPPTEGPIADPSASPTVEPPPNGVAPPNDDPMAPGAAVVRPPSSPPPRGGRPASRRSPPIRIAPDARRNCANCTPKSTPRANRWRTPRSPTSCSAPRAPAEPIRPPRSCCTKKRCSSPPSPATSTRSSKRPKNYPRGSPSPSTTDTTTRSAAWRTCRAVRRRFRELFMAILKQANQAYERDDFDMAGRLAQTALGMARKGSPDTATTLKLSGRIKELGFLKTQFEKAQAAEQTLRAAPDDPAANREWGYFQAMLKGNFKRGLPFLARGDNASWAALAVRTLSARAPDELVAAADGWWAASENQKDYAREHTRRFAGSLYYEAQPNVDGLTALKVEKRLAESGFVP
ncbi:MAG: hypothetical protein QM811_24640 [Pirellulales bacterium]